MLTRTKIALAAALALGTNVTLGAAPAAWARLLTPSLLKIIEA